MIKIIGLTALFVVLIFAASLVELYTQLGRYQQYWNRRNQQTAVSGEILYVAMGDSAAQGIGAGKADHGYVGLISKEIERRNPGKPVRTVNISKSGAKVSDALSTQIPRLKEMPVNDQTVVTVEIGANDMINFNPQDFEQQMNQFMSQLPKQTLISDIPYFGDSRLKNREGNVEAANKIMYRLAAQHGFKLVPLFEQTREHGTWRSFAADWFHPSDWMYKHGWAAAFIDRLKV